MGRLRGFGFTGAMLFYASSTTPGASMKDDYEVGYKKPPKEYRFKPKRLRDAVQGAPRQRKEKPLDLAGIFNKPLLVKRGGKTVAMNAHEAELISLAKRALKGEPRATKLFLKHCDAAGLLDPEPGEQTHGVFVIPPSANRAIVPALLQTYGLPPWDPAEYAALEKEYETDQAHIEELFKQFMEDLENG
jgi:hypothetical protein